jgi:hypothetical protein
MTKQQIGGYEFKNQCNEIRNSTSAIRKSLTRIIEENPGPQTTAVLIAKMALEVSNITNAVTNIEAIGKGNKTTG